MLILPKEQTEIGKCSSLVTRRDATSEKLGSKAMMLITIRMLRLYVGATHGAQPGLAIEREGLFVLAYIRRFYFILHLAYTNLTRLSTYIP